MGRIFNITVFAIFASASCAFAQGQQEELELTTYYPAPNGVYGNLSATNLSANRLAIGSAASVPTTNGVVNFAGITTANQPAQVNSRAGDIYYNSTNQELRINNGAAWISMPAMPAGVIMMHGSATAPAGWLLCDGSAVSRTTYASLFAAISTTFGAGNGTTTFNLPDLRERFVVGAGGDNAAITNSTGYAVGATGTSNTNNLITLTSAQIPAHAHPASIPANSGDHSHTYHRVDLGQYGKWGSEVSVGTGETDPNVGGSGAHSHTVTVNNNIGGNGTHENRPPYIALSYIIKT